MERRYSWCSAEEMVVVRLLEVRLSRLPISLPHPRSTSMSQRGRPDWPTLSRQTEARPAEWRLHR
ncbi:unnamed protein product, partial [Nesidiocoris tenuis]